MPSENSCQQAVCSSTQTSSTPGSDTPSASETMSTISTLTASFQISSPVYDNMRKSFQDSFTSLGVELSRLEIENKRLVEHNTTIEKELETWNEHNTATEKELKALREENAELCQAKNDAMKKLAEVEEEKDALQKELDELGELREVLGWKKKCQELETRATEDRERMEKFFKDYQQEMEKRATENQEKMENLVSGNQKRMEKSMEDYQQKMEKRATENQERMENLVSGNQKRMEKSMEDYQQKMEKRATGNQERMENLVSGNQKGMENLVSGNQKRMEKAMEDYQQKMKKRIADVEKQSQNKLEQEINRIKANHSRDIQTLTSCMGFKGLEDMTGGYIVRKKPYERIPGGMIQVSLAEAIDTFELFDPVRLCEDKNTTFLYVVRDQYQDFKKFTKLAESVFGLQKDHIDRLRGSKWINQSYLTQKASVVKLWKEEASQKDRVYILLGKSGTYVNSDTVYYTSKPSPDPKK